MSAGYMPPLQPVQLYRSTQIDLPSKNTGRTYRIFIFEPPVPAPPAGYPVMTVIDANMTFPIAATMAATFALEGRAALVVGVGYPTENFFEILRFRNRDLTPLTPAATPAAGIRANPGEVVNADDYGGADTFFRFLMEELGPAISTAYPVNGNDGTLYGHSLGGLFALGTLFNHPESFRNFVASSPSIFWNGRAVLNDEASFVRDLEVRAASPRVLITVGAKEEDMPATPMPNLTPEQMMARVREWRMVQNAQELAARLGSANGGDGYQVQFCAFDGEDHLTVVPASIARALSFALRT